MRKSNREERQHDRRATGETVKIDLYNGGFVSIDFGGEGLILMTADGAETLARVLQIAAADLRRNLSTWSKPQIIGGDEL